MSEKTDKGNPRRNGSIGASQNRRKTARGENPGREKYDNRPGIIRFFADQRTHKALGIIFILTAVVIAVMCISHLKNGASDYSLASWQSIGEMAKDSGAVSNTGGPLGAKLSHILLVEGLGAGSFILMFYLAVIGLRLLSIVRLRFWPFTFKCLFSAISISIILGLFTINSESFFHWGGRHGHQINLWLESVGSWLLAYAVSIALICCLGCMFLNELTSMVRRVRSHIPKRVKKASSEKREPKNLRVDFYESGDGEVEFTKQYDNGEDGSEEASSEVTDHHEREEQRAHAAAIAGLHPLEIEDESETGNDNEEDFQDTVSVPYLVSNDTQEVVTHESPTDSSLGLYDPRAELSHYRFPTLDLLEDRDTGKGLSPEELEANKEMLVKTLLDYKIRIDSITATVGPSVTLYEIVPSEGILIAQIRRLEADIARNLGVLGIRIIPTTAGKSTVGLEVPNSRRRMVPIKDVLGSQKFRETRCELPIALGRGIDNDVFIYDLVNIPHLLVAGATGQGKSVGLNCILASLLYSKHPTEMKLVLIDPKKVEFSLYGRLYKHYLACREDDIDDPIITDPENALNTLKSLCTEMDNRYEIFRKANVNKIQPYNRKIIEKRLIPENGHRYLPFIVVVIDEYADLVMMGAKEISLYIARLAQKGRAAGIHVIIATQRPSTDVITGMIKANFPGRIAFRTMQQIDSRTILDRTGAEQLTGQGDMLFRVNGAPERLQCAFIDTEEIDRITEFIENQTGCASVYILPEVPSENGSIAAGGSIGPRDAIFDECARFIVSQPTASTSSLQRRFGIGYNKAGKIMDQLEALRVVGPAQGQKPRTVLIDPDALEDLLRTL